MAKAQMCKATFLGVYYKEAIPKRVRCPECGRRVGPHVMPDDDGDYENATQFAVSVPNHKVKGWYRGRKQVSPKRDGRRKVHRERR
jgi:hypothetical protein